MTLVKHIAFASKFIGSIIVVTLLASKALAENYALLVGVSNYPSLGEDLQLTGPANDVVLSRELLLKRGFLPEHLQVLADGVPQAGDPTKSNITASLNNIVAAVKQGDFVYLHFAGHGSQQPTRAGKFPPEPDGRDEIFLPRDIGKWNNAVAAVDNALIDSDMNLVITKMRGKGAFVWAIFDSCHSGTMTRGAPSDEVRFRKVEPNSLGIPQKALDLAHMDAPQTRGNSAPKSGVLGTVADLNGKGGFVAFYAAQTVETTPEMRLPAGELNRQSHGLFSYVIAETLEKYSNITYRQLGQQVLQRYASLGMNSPTPLFEGTGLDAPIFGSQTQATIRQWPLRIAKGELSIGAGSLQQFSDGAIFAVVPTAASPDAEIVGYLRADKLSPLTSIMSTISYGEKLALETDKLKVGQYVRLVDPNLRLTLQVALPPAASPTNSESSLEKTARQLIIDLQANPKQELRIEWVNPGQHADIRLRLSDDKLWLLPADGKWIKEGLSKSHSISLATTKDKLADTIFQSFRTIAKTTNLLRLAGFFGSKSMTGGAKGLEVKATLIQSNGGARIPIDPAALPELKDGDKIEFVLRNKGRSMVDVTALYFDSAYGISAMYPESGRINRIEVNAEDTFSIELNADTTGTERIMILAVNAKPASDPADFSFLAQQQLVATRNLSSSVDLLFKEIGFGITSRGATNARTSMDDADVRVFGWRVLGK